MPRGKAAYKTKTASGANLAFEQNLRQAADNFRDHTDAAEDKHLAPALTFLKHAFGIPLSCAWVAPFPKPNSGDIRHPAAAHGASGGTT